MLSKRQMNKYSEVLLWALAAARKTKLKRGDIILIRYEQSAIRMAEILQSKILDMGMNPVSRMGLTSRMEKDFFQKANGKQLIFQAPGEKELYDRLSGGLYLHAPDSLTHLNDIDPKRIAKATLARKPLRDILDKREEKGLFGWTLCVFPTNELARKAGLSLKQYASQIIKACCLDQDDPVNEWKKIYRNVRDIKDWLNSMQIKVLHIESENVDLKIYPGERRRWIGISGHNIPSFEIFLSPDCRETEGIYYANQPSYRSGNYVEGVQIEFKKGKAVKVKAKKGERFLAKQLLIDKGASRVGEFSLTDKGFSKINKYMANTLFDENYGGRFGNCHLAFGASYSNTFDGDPANLTRKMKERLGFNDSALHWDLVNTERKTVTADLVSGKRVIIYENGIFKY
ncbi:MAG: aminopeptidase [Pseudomonadota bacterium]